VAVSIRGESEYRLERSRQSRWLAPVVFRHADRLLVQSPLMARELLRAFARRSGDPSEDELRAKLRIVPNGIDVEPAGCVPAERSAVLFVGRLTATKGVDVLIDAMRECPGESLVIVGDGPERARLEARAQALSNVTFAGAASRADVDQYFARAKMLVLPSFHEGQPNVVMEAMARGVPVVACAVGGIPDLIRDGETGLLLQPGDAAGTAAAIRRLAGDRELCRRLSDAAREDVRRYDWTAVIAALEQELVECRLTSPSSRDRSR